jgi:type I restriction enzyme, S subunit
VSIPPGYQATEVGFIPDDWEAVPLGRLGSFSKGQGIRKDQASSGDIPCIRYGEIYTDHNDIVRKYRSRISREVATTSRVLRKGDLLFAGSGETKEEIGKCVAFVDDCEAYAGGDIIVLSPHSANSVLLGYLLNSEVIARQKAARAQGDAVVHISAKALADVIAPLPTSDIEQTAIAEALSDMDEAIAAQEAVIAKKRALKSAAMQALLSGTRRLPGFSAEWEEKPLRDVAQIDRDNLGASTAPTYEFRYISLEDVDRGILRQTTKHVFAKAPSRARRRVASGDVLFATVRPNLQSHLLVLDDAKDLVCSTGFAVIRCDMSKADPRFVFFNLFGGFVEKQIERLLAGSNYPAISNKDVADIRLKMPDVAEQSAIAEVIYDMDDDLNGQVAQLEKLRKVKAGMMQQLLTGKIRLI